MTDQTLQDFLNTRQILLRLFLLLPGVVWLHSIAVAQAPCNHTSRTVAVVAGDQNVSTVPCAGFSATIAGQVVSGPAQCMRGGAHYAGTVYVCGGAANLVNCNPRGNKVEITTYSDGACPDLSGLVPGLSFESWARVPASVRNGLRCVPPKKRTTFDWSASTVACATGQKHLPIVGQVHQGADGSCYVIAQGPPYASNGTIDPFATGYELSQASTPSVVPGILGNLILPLHPRVAGVFVTGTVSFEHHLGGQVEKRDLSVTGRVLANGRFDLQSSCVVVAEGRPQAYGRWVTCDGNALTIVCDEARNGNVWDVTGWGFFLRLSREVPEVWPLRDWVRDPFDIPWYADVEYTEIVDGATTVVRRAFDPAIADGVDTQWRIDTGGSAAHPVSLQIFDPVGLLRVEVVYEDYRTLQPGLWRPFQVRRTSWLDPAHGEDRVVVTLRVTDARMLSAAEQVATPARCADDQLWFHWL